MTYLTKEQLKAPVLKLPNTKVIEKVYIILLKLPRKIFPYLKICINVLRHKLTHAQMNHLHVFNMERRAGPSRLATGFGLPSQSSSSSSTPARPRKRQRKPELWERNAAKVKCTKGEAYISPSTCCEVQPEKPGPPCTCKKRCYTNFMDDERRKVFDCFWGLGDKRIQDAYFHGLI